LLDILWLFGEQQDEWYVCVDPKSRQTSLIRFRSFAISAVDEVKSFELANSFKRMAGTPFKDLCCRALRICVGAIKGAARISGKDEHVATEAKLLSSSS
jgi:hypothetical protein